MKIELIFATVLFLIAGITLTDNSAEVMGQTEGTLKKYQNATTGISFQYPSNWREETEFACVMGSDLCSLGFFIAVPKLDPVTNTSSNAAECAGTESKNLLEIVILRDKCDIYRMKVTPIKLDNPNIYKPCLCTTLKDFVRWDYNTFGKDEDTFINDNQTTIGNNYSAWQMETVSTSSIRDKELEVYAVNGKLGYSFLYAAPADSRYSKYLDGFKNMLKSVTLTPLKPEKKRSFLNSSDTELFGPIISTHNGGQIC